MTRLLVMSDSHGNNTTVDNILSREEQQVDLKIHLGDFCASVQDYQKAFDYIVPGNNDFANLPDAIKIKIESQQIIIHHGHLASGFSFQRTRVQGLLKYARSYEATMLLFGHSHVPYFGIHEGIYLINPGSTDYPRDMHEPSYGILTLDASQVSFSLKNARTGEKETL